MDCGSIEMVKKVNLVFKTPEGGSINRASDILRKKRQNFAGFSGANSRKNQPISRDFRGKNFKIRGKIGQFRGIFAGKKSKFAEKSADFAGFWWEKSQNSQKIGRFRGILAEKSQFSKDFRGKFLEKSADFTRNFGGNFVKKQSVKNSRFRWIFFGKFR